MTTITPQSAAHYALLCVMGRHAQHAQRLFAAQAVLKLVHSVATVQMCALSLLR